MPKPLETSAKLPDVSVSQEIQSIGHLDKQSQDDQHKMTCRWLHPPRKMFPGARVSEMFLCPLVSDHFQHSPLSPIKVTRRRPPGPVPPLDHSRPASWRSAFASSG